ncbi:hypothetical protein PM082_011981 [Marasmius tenuissimus]|nr:hypothetical protein PM082_011981 [Marasmius tenuissimus]
MRRIYCNSDVGGTCRRAAAYTSLIYDGAGNIVGSDIYACPSFYRYPKTSDLCDSPLDDINASKGGIMLHELSHATAGTLDIAYVCALIRDKLSPQQRLYNADNYQCMALFVYRYNC